MDPRHTSLYLLGGTSPRDVGPEIVGAKAFNLMVLSEAGLAVPPAFVLGTGSCRAFYEAGGQLSEEQREHALFGIRELETETGLRFGAGRRPLLVSVRSGAAASMPGMLETILNVGLSDATLPGLLRATGDPLFVWDSYRRLIQAYAEVVEGCPAGPFGAVLHDALVRAEVPAIGELDVSALRDVVRYQQEVYRTLTGRPFPQDPTEQLLGAVAAVFRSWNGARAVEYRAQQGLEDLVGTAVTVQAMVFGNRGVTSGSGVGFTRDPASGENRAYVDFLLNAQGEDVVAGRHTVADAEASLAAVPGLSRQLSSLRRKLEALFHDVQDFEFTVEEGTLWMLQTRSAKRTPWAALQIACDLVDEGLIDATTALERLEGYELEAISRVRLVEGQGATVLARGTPAGGGVGSGRVAFGLDAAQRFHRDGDPVILVREEASTEDIAGLAVCQGLVTSSGARTSHAAVVARQLGVPCVVGCRDLSIDGDRRQARVGQVNLYEGDLLTLDAGTGVLYAGTPEVRVERPEELIARVRRWQEETRSMR
jgi:pyruvate,orthophosphate dikinase